MSGYVYFIRAEQSYLIKIGYSVDPQARLIALRRLNADQLTLMAVCPAEPEEERRLHKVFREERHHGEWFKPSQKLRDKIASVLANHEQTISPVPADSGSFYTLEEAAEQIGISAPIVALEIRDGKLYSEERHGCPVVYSSDLVGYLNSLRTVKPSAARGKGRVQRLVSPIASES